MVLWTVGLLAEPEDEVRAPVPDMAAELDAAWPGSEVAPLPQGALRPPEEGAGPLERAPLVPGVLWTTSGGGLCGQRGLLVIGGGERRLTPVVMGGGCTRIRPHKSPIS